MSPFFFTQPKLYTRPSPVPHRAYTDVPYNPIHGQTFYGVDDLFETRDQHLLESTCFLNPCQHYLLAPSTVIRRLVIAYRTLNEIVQMS